MRQKNKLILGAIWGASIIISFFIGKLYGSLNHILNPVVVDDTIITSDMDNYVWIKKYSWGIAGNHQIIYLTDNVASSTPDEKNDMIFNNAETLFYRVKNDTLHIYSRNHYPIDPRKYKGIYIKMHQLENPDFMNLYREYHSAIKTTDWMN